MRAIRTLVRTPSNPGKNLMSDPHEIKHPGWKPLPYERLPQPTYFPSGLAMGTTFIFWGVITSWVIFAVGISLFTASLAGWIYEIRLQRKNAE
jgi:hypothetical protein